MAGRTKFPSKITTKNIGLKVPILESVAKDSDPDPVAVMRAYGTIADTETVQSQYGECTRYIGQMEAVNLIDGTIHRAKTMFLPSVAETALSDLVEKVEGSGPVQFGIDVTVEYNDSAKGGTKFKFSAEPLIQPKEDDSIAKLGKSLGAPPMLSKPKKSTK